MSSQKKLTALMVLEMMGKPKEHLEKSLKELTKKIAEEKGVSVIEERNHEATEVKEKKDLFTTFAELEIEVEEPLILARLMFKYMPSHLEVLEPENFLFSNNDYSEILNELTRRLHKYEELVRVMQMEQKILANQMKKLKENK